MLSYGRQQPLTPTFHSQHYGDDIDDSIVPSTPTLVVPRRADGFAEAVSSPHIPSQRLFTFGPPSDTTTGAGSSGLDDTRMDLLQYDDGTGRSVPTTPSQVSPPAEAIDQEQHGNIDLLDLVEERHMLRDELFDVQPSSSDGHSHRAGGDVPAITITSVLDSSLDSPMEQQEAESDNVALQEDFEQSQDGSNEQVHSLPPTRTESSVTSSDEDKIDLGASTSDLVP
jgi:nucleoprotein TPR